MGHGRGREDIRRDDWEKHLLDDRMVEIGAIELDLPTKAAPALQESILELGSIACFTKIEAMFSVTGGSRGQEVGAWKKVLVFVS